MQHILINISKLEVRPSIFIKIPQTLFSSWNYQHLLDVPFYPGGQIANSFHLFWKRTLTCFKIIPAIGPKTLSSEPWFWQFSAVEVSMYSTEVSERLAKKPFSQLGKSQGFLHKEKLNISRHFSVRLRTVDAYTIRTTWVGVTWPHYRHFDTSLRQSITSTMC